jgi:hypothetical protein
MLLDQREQGLGPLWEKGANRCMSILPRCPEQCRQGTIDLAIQNRDAYARYSHCLSRNSSFVKEIDGRSLLLLTRTPIVLTKEERLYSIQHLEDWVFATSRSLKCAVATVRSFLRRVPRSGTANLGTHKAAQH